MTPAEYLEIKGRELAVIEAAEKRIDAARKQADKCPPPKHHRPAEPSDIREGAVIWHARPKRDGGDYWNVVAQVRDPRDSWKAYVSDDGCRYGIAGAYVEVQPDP